MIALIYKISLRFISFFSTSKPWGFPSIKSIISCAYSGPASSCIKCPGPFITISCAEGILFKPSTIPGLFPVTGSLSLFAIKNGFSHFSNTFLKAS